MASALLTSTLRIYDEEVAEKFQELKNAYSKITSYQETSASRTLNWIINLAYQRFKQLEEEERTAKEKKLKATEFER